MATLPESLASEFLPHILNFQKVSKYQLCFPFNINIVWAFQNTIKHFYLTMLPSTQLHKVSLELPNKRRVCCSENKGRPCTQDPHGGCPWGG